MKEWITVCPTDQLLYARNFLLQGYRPDPELCEDLILWLESSQRSGPLDRAVCESSPTYQQPIPYVLVYSGGRLLTYQRLKPGEKRLSRKHSIGFGGHIDWHLDKYYAYLAAAREIHEELDIDPELDIDDIADSLQPLGVVKDWSNEVGAVHLGIVFGLEIGESVTVKAKEKELKTSWSSDPFGLVMQETYHELSLENWSRMILETYANLPEGKAPWNTSKSSRTSRTTSKKQPASKKSKRRKS